MKVVSIFNSIDGEINAFLGAGQVSTFIRLYGCNAKCRWCDTQYSWQGGNYLEMTVDEVVAKHLKRHITITGGEPLLQMQEVEKLCYQLLSKALMNRLISIETNGYVTPSSYLLSNPNRLRMVMDCKLPSSGVELPTSQRYAALSSLRSVDVVKFVIADDRDFKEAWDLSRHLWYGKEGVPIRAYSPLAGVMDPAVLVQWVDNLEYDAVVSLQLHKVIWPGVATADNEH